jgi:predicted DNA-binding transcriptional regulator AlpA
VKILRKSEAAARLGCGLSTFHERFVKTGRVKLIYLGKRSVGVLESDIDRLIGELVAESAVHPDRRALAPKPKRGCGRPAKQSVAQAQV